MSRSKVGLSLMFMSNTKQKWESFLEFVKECDSITIVTDVPCENEIAYTKKGFKKFEPEQLVAIGKQAGFDNIQVKDIAKGKSFVVIYSKN